MTVLELVPSRSGSASRLGSWRTRPVGHEAGELALRRANEHVAREQAVPSLLGDYPHLQPVGRVGAGIKVLDEQLAGLDMGERTTNQAGEMALLHLLVGGAPVDLAADIGVGHEELVLGRAAGEAASGGHQGAAGAEASLLPDQRRRHQRRRRQIVQDMARAHTGKRSDPETGAGSTKSIHVAFPHSNIDRPGSGPPAGDIPGPAQAAAA